MQDARMVSADGLWVSLTMEHLERETYGLDFVSGGLHDFKNSSPERYRLTAKADPTIDPNTLISCLRAGIEDVCGVKPSVMPPSYASGLMEFEWSVQGIDEGESFRKLVSLVQAARIGKVSSIPQGGSIPKGKQCEFCGRTNDGGWEWSKCKQCGSSFCPEHAEPAEHNCSHKVALGKSGRWPKGGRRENTWVDDIGVYRTVSGTRLRRSHKKGYAIAMATVAILLIATLPYYAPDQLLPLTSYVRGAENTARAWVDQLLHATPGQTAELATFSPAQPDFVDGSANVAFPQDYQTLANYSLTFINRDRALSGLQPVTLSPIASGQQHADSMLYYDYFSHWDVQGYKPYMRYSLLGGRGGVAENIGQSYCTTSTADSSSLTVAPCSLQNLENGIAASEWGMMYNDAAWGNGHRDNILNPTHNRVSIGISYDLSSGKVYFVEDFEDYLINPVTFSFAANSVTLSGTVSTYLDFSQGEVTVMYDTTPLAIPQPELNTNPSYTGAYGGGTPIGAVFTPCPAGYVCSGTTTDGLIASYATTWQSTAGSLLLQFSLSQFTSKYGPGIYTLYLWPSQTASSPITSISLQVGT